MKYLVVYILPSSTEIRCAVVEKERIVSFLENFGNTFEHYNYDMREIKKRFLLIEIEPNYTIKSFKVEAPRKPLITIGEYYA